MRFGQNDNIVNNLDYAISIAHAQYTTTQTGAETTLLGGPVLVMLYVSAIAAADSTNFITFKVLQSDDGFSSSEDADSSQYLAGDSWDLVLNATGETGIHVFQYIPKPSYYSIKVVGTVTLTVDVTYSVFVIQGAIHQPATD